MKAAVPEKTGFPRQAPALAGLLLLSLFALAGCSGGGGGASSGDPVSSPAPGVTATALDIAITSATVSSHPVAEFTVTDQEGRPYTALRGDQLAWTFAKLVPDGPTHTWRSYINRERAARPAAMNGWKDGWLDGPKMASAIQATTEAGAGGTLVNLGGGRYRYTFATDVTNMTSPVAVAWEPTRTHRVAVQTGGGTSLPLANAWFDFVPAGGAPLATRDIVATATCNACHDNLGAHEGSAMVEVGYCVTCHNPGTDDPNSGESLDLGVLIHKLHRGDQLPRVAAGYRYLVWGSATAPKEFDTVVYPFEGRARHASDSNRGMACQKCHAGPDDQEWADRFNVTTTPDGGTWKVSANKRACGACHEDVPGLGPAGAPWIDGGKESHLFASDNTPCVICHNDGIYASSPETAHRLDDFERAQEFAVVIDGNPLLDAGADTLTLRLRLEDGDGADRTGDASFRLFVAAGSKEYRNYDIDGSAANVAGTDVTVGAINGGYYPVTVDLGAGTGAAMAAVGGSGMVMVAGSVDDGTTLYFPNVAAPFALDDARPVARREVATMDGCRNCHMGIHAHSPASGRNENLQTCAVCHNSNLFRDNAFEGSQRGYPADHRRNSGLMTMVHAIHNNSAHRRGVEGKEVGYPAMARGDAGKRDARTCTSCHTATGYRLPLAAGVTGPTFAIAGDDGSIGVRAAIEQNHRKLTPTVGVCVSCHVDFSRVDFETGTGSDPAWNHMKQMGGGESVAWSWETPDNQGESCADCHGPGGTRDIRTVHGLD